MATAHLKGAAVLAYTPIGGYETVHLLAVPLLRSQAWGFRSTRRRRRWEAWSADFTEREVFTLGAAVDEIAALIRFENEPDLLRTLLAVALEENATVTYYPTGMDDDGYPLKVVLVDGAADEIVLQPDRDRFAFGEWEVALVLRRVDGGTLEGLLS